MLLELSAATFGQLPTVAPETVLSHTQALNPIPESQDDDDSSGMAGTDEEGEVKGDAFSSKATSSHAWVIRRDVETAPNFLLVPRQAYCTSLEQAIARSSIEVVPPTPTSTLRPPYRNPLPSVPHGHDR